MPCLTENDSCSSSAFYVIMLPSPGPVFDPKLRCIDMRSIHFHCRRMSISVPSHISSSGFGVIMLSSPGPVFDPQLGCIDMRSIHFHHGRMSISVPSHISHIDIESMPVQSYLMFRSLVQWKMLTGEWLHDKSKSVRVRVGKVKTAALAEVFHQGFQNGKDDYHALPGHQKATVPGNGDSRFSIDAISQHGFHRLLP